MLKFVAAAFALSLALAACTPMVVVETANLRVAHLSPDAPNVDVWLDGKVVPELVNVPFKTVSGYLKIPVGKHDIAVYVTKTTTGPVIDVKGIDLEKKSYTVGAIGLVSAIKAQVYTDDLTTNTTKARVRVIHASPDAPSVDVGVKGEPPALAVVKGIKFPDATGYLELGAGVLPLEIRLAGTATIVKSFDTPALELGKVYTVFAVDIATKLGVVAVADVAAQ
jgi:hypothetical protein